MIFKPDGGEFNIFNHSFDIYQDTKENKCMFTKEDVERTKHPLMKMFRHIIVEKNITLKQFIEMHDFYMQAIDATPKETNWRKNNLLKALLKKNEITINLFEYVLINILEMNINKMTYEFSNSNGEKETFEIDCSF